MMKTQSQVLLLGSCCLLLSLLHTARGQDATLADILRSHSSHEAKVRHRRYLNGLMQQALLQQQQARLIQGPSGAEMATVGGARGLDSAIGGAVRGISAALGGLSNAGRRVGRGVGRMLEGTGVGLGALMEGAGRAFGNMAQGRGTLGLGMEMGGSSLGSMLGNGGIRLGMALSRIGNGALGPLGGGVYPNNMLFL